MEYRPFTQYDYILLIILLAGVIIYMYYSKYKR